MSTQLGEAFVPIRATLDKLDGDLEQARGKVQGAMGKIGQIASGLGENLQKAGTIALAGIGAIGAAALGAAVGIAKLAADAEPLVGLQQGFAAVTERIGSGAKEMIARLQDASGGLITNRDLMQSFNKAAALVGDDFAKRLPDAMSLVGKASRSTGQDMGFLFDSLVTGIGRVSPMILDNLGIQVSLAEVTERAGKMFGKSTEELSKQEQQAALTDIVMEKLSKTYGDVPDATPTFAKFGVLLSNLKDDIGLKLLPVLAPLGEKFLGLAQNALPILADVLDKSIIPALGSVADFLGPVIEKVGEFLGRLGEGVDNLTAFQVLLMQLLPPELFGQVMNLIAGVQAFIQTVVDFITPIAEAITQFVSWQDVLVALGIAIASVIIPIIASFVASIAPIIAAVLLVIAVVALLRNAWEKDWGGIRTTLTDFWEKTGRPALEELQRWLGENLPIAIQFLSDFWTNTLKPAIESVWAWLSTVLIPFLANVVYPWLRDKLTQALQALSNFWTNTLKPAIITVWNWLSTVLIPFLRDTLAPWLQDKLTEALQTLSNFWTNTLKPAIEGVWGFIKTDLIPLFLKLKELFDVALSLALTALAGLWQNVLKPAMEAVWKFIRDNVIPIVEDIAKALRDTLGPIIKDVAGWLSDKLKAAFEGISRAIQGVIGWIADLIEKLKGIKLPGFLTPGSPTPFETGLRGIASALKEVNALSGMMPLFNGLGAVLPAPALAGASEQPAPISSSYTANTTIYTNRDPLRVLHAARHLDQLGRLR